MAGRQPHWLLSRGRFLHGPDGTAVRVAGIVGDITDAKVVELAARETAARFASLVESMADAMVSTSPAGLITGWNRAAETLFGWRAQEVIGQSITVLVPPDRLEESRAPCARRWPGRVVEMIALARDNHRAPPDGAGPAAPGHPRRAHRPAEPGAARRPARPGAGRGDLLLVETANRLRSALRPGDSVARFGGDEFVVICADADGDIAAAVAARLHDALSPAMEVEGQRHHVTASIGIALSPPLRGEDLMRSADVAMYEAKSTGRARSRMFQTPMAERAQSQLELSLQLREAVAAGALELQYQPVVDLRTGELAGVEALTRWNRPGQSAVPPSVFIAVAEQTG